MSLLFTTQSRSIATDWASLPAASASAGLVVRVTDLNNALFMSDGTRWEPLNGQALIARGHAAITAPADINENTLASVTIPAGLMGVNGALFIREIWTMTNNANVKTRKVKLGSTIFSQTSLASNATLFTEHAIANRNSAAAQIGSIVGGSVFYGFSGNAPATGTENTANALTLAITGQKATAGDALVLESYDVFLQHV